MEFLETPLFDDDVYKLLVRFGLNLIFAVLTVILAYLPYRNGSKSRYLFTFLMMNIMVFFICFVLKKLDLGLGMALGLFAIFAIIRFRTDAIPAKEMTYLFMLIGIAVINSLSNKKTSYIELMVANCSILCLAILLERLERAFGLSTKKPKKKLANRTLVFDQLELLRPECHADLMADIEQKTGITPQSIEIKKIDYSSGLANIVIHYEEGYSMPVSKLQKDES